MKAQPGEGLMIVNLQTSRRFLSRSSAGGLVLGDGVWMEAGHWAETGGAPDPGTEERRS